MVVLGTFIRFKKLVELLRVAFCYYWRRPRFFFEDLKLYCRYLFLNPYRLTSGYGETPLTALDEIARQCLIKPTDTLIELGSGTGRTALWLHHFIGCKTIGIETNATFIKKAPSGPTFLRQHWLEADLSDATYIYLYGTGMDDPEIDALTRRLQKTLREGALVITTSYPLEGFEQVKHFPINYTWGTATVYLQRKAY